MPEHETSERKWLEKKLLKRVLMNKNQINVSKEKLDRPLDNEQLTADLRLGSSHWPTERLFVELNLEEQWRAKLRPAYDCTQVFGGSDVGAVQETSVNTKRRIYG